MDRTSLTLKAVLETTERLAAEIGCQNTTLQEIIKRSGMSKGAIYHYVQSKDELFGLILEEHMIKKVEEYRNKAAGHQRQGAGAGQTPSGAGDGGHPHGFGQAQGQPPGHPSGGTGGSLAPGRLGPLTVIVRGLLEPGNQRQIVLRRCFIYLLSRQEQPDVSRIVVNLQQSWITFTAEWIEACQSMGLLPPTVPVRRTSAMIISFLFGLMVQKSISEHEEPAERDKLDPDTVLAAIAGMLTPVTPQGHWDGVVQPKA
ncbi:TetR/AcrR family transcriptional regulator [Paenibacillus mesotrionivorans]|uniref:TetR/AcrR family transcriptional regulator n=1 Tax=Paenibacillus mesotrionivorans TaxID=3160968 RepID=A0ACC7NVW8_9BACL